MFCKTGVELLEYCKRENVSIGEYSIREEMATSNCTREQVISNMMEVLVTMRNSTNDARLKPVMCVSGMTGGNSYKYNEYIKSGKSIIGGIMADAMAMALSCSEINASMGRVVACPTAGSCGIVPAALMSSQKQMNFTDDELILGLFTASGIGIIIGENATFAGAEGGCQAECGAGAAMAAGMIVEMCGGDPQMALHAASISIKSILGLICDPVAGLVEIPCVKRNAAGVVNAIASADLALSGIPSYIPFDQIVQTMYEVGKRLPFEYRETGIGGVAGTEWAKGFTEKVFGGKV